MTIKLDKSLDWIQEMLRVTILDKLCTYYWVRRIDKLNLEVWKKFEIREKHIDHLIKEFQKNGISINKDLFTIYKDETNTDWGTESVNTPSNQTADPEWKLEDNKGTPTGWDNKTWTKDIKWFWKRKK